jgi:hypothetical protein
MSARRGRRLTGTQEVQAGAQTQQVVVMLDLARVSPDQVRAMLEPLGYQASPSGGIR